MQQAKHGARNRISARVTAVKSDGIMSLIKFEVITPAEMAAVITTESLEDLALEVGDDVRLIIKAVNVLPVKE